MNEPASKSTNGGGYGKRPLWQWILLYIVVGGVVYYLIYYFVFAQNGYNYGMYKSSENQQGIYKY